MVEANPADLRRRVPSVDQALQEPGLRALAARHGRGPVVDALREALAAVRETATQGRAAALETSLAQLPDAVAARLSARATSSLVSVINATGVVIHTNLGRAPLSREAAAHVAAIAAGYSNLELDLESGSRGDRETHAEERLRRILDCPATLVVNNNAAAVLLAVNTLADGREVIVSRGQLVEIGGSFRIPDVVEKAGGRLREVGTTNRTRLTDYRGAISPQTGALLRVHPSNFRIVGFAEEASRDELVALATETKAPLIEDMGSGLLAPLPTVPSEETVSQALRAGVDVVTFSGDKLLGGPQAGLLAGRADLLAAMRQNPLYRALRVDKMTMAALDVVLGDHEAQRAATAVPVLRLLHRDLDGLRAAGARVTAALRGLALLDAVLLESTGPVGGGAAPTLERPTIVVSLRHQGCTPDVLAAALRRAPRPVVPRVAKDAVWLDLRAIPEEDEAALVESVRAALHAVSTA